MKKNRFSKLSLEALESRWCPSTLTWIGRGPGGAGGDGITATDIGNWNTHSAPATGDTITVPATIVESGVSHIPSVNWNSVASLNSLTWLGTGTLNLQKSLTITNKLDFEKGTLDGTAGQSFDLDLTGGSSSMGADYSFWIGGTITSDVLSFTVSGTNDVLCIKDVGSTKSTFNCAAVQVIGSGVINLRGNMLTTTSTDINVSGSFNFYPNIANSGALSVVGPSSAATNTTHKFDNTGIVSVEDAANYTVNMPILNEGVPGSPTSTASYFQVLDQSAPASGYKFDVEGTNNDTYLSSFGQTGGNLEIGSVGSTASTGVYNGYFVLSGILFANNGVVSSLGSGTNYVTGSSSFEGTATLASGWQLNSTADFVFTGSITVNASGVTLETAYTYDSVGHTLTNSLISSLGAFTVYAAATANEAQLGSALSTGYTVKAYNAGSFSGMSSLVVAPSADWSNLVVDFNTAYWDFVHA